MKLPEKFKDMIDWQQVNKMILSYQDNIGWVYEKPHRKWIFNILLFGGAMCLLVILRWLIF